MKRKLILGITAIAAALVMAMISPLASADKNDDQSHHDDESGKVSNPNPVNTNTAPTAVYTHLDVGICTIDPILLTSKGWCPDGNQYEFFIHDAYVTQYSVIAITTVPPVTFPLTKVQCSEETINYTAGANQGFGILCNSSPLPGSGLNYIVFNPSTCWLAQHNAPNNNNNYKIKPNC